MLKKILINLAGEEIGTEMYQSWNWKDCLTICGAAFMYYVCVVLLCA